MAKKTSYHHNGTNLLVYAAAGGLIGATTTFLLATETGKKVRKGLNHTCHDFCSKAQDYAHDMAEKGEEMFTRHDDSMSHKYLPLVAGAIGGSVLGATIACLFEDEEAHYGLKEKSLHWMDKARDFIDLVHSKVNTEEAEDLVSASKQHMTKGIQNALDWTMLGLRLWKNMKKGR